LSPSPFRGKAGKGVASADKNIYSFSYSGGRPGRGLLQQIKIFILLVVQGEGREGGCFSR